MHKSGTQGVGAELRMVRRGERRSSSWDPALDRGCSGGLTPPTVAAKVCTGKTQFYSSSHHPGQLS
jgi:hypothetical protein